MKAVEVSADGRVRVVERAVPSVGPEEALFAPAAVGICGSDLLDWYVRKKAGSILGHEVSGEIVAVGAAVTTFAPGDRVVVHHHAPCLQCAACRAGRYVHCGQWRSSALDPGGMAERVRIPASNLARDTLKVPPHLSHEEAAWTEPLATVVKALDRARLTPGQSLFVVGLGAAGQLALRLARSRGVTALAATDPVASRLMIARQAGARVFDAAHESAGSGGRQISDGQGFDVVFVCPGHKDVILSALEAVAPGGVLLLFTMTPPGEQIPFPVHDLYFREVSVVPSYSCGPTDTRAALELLSSGAVPVEDLVTHRFPIDRAVEAFARAREPEGSLKVMLTFPEDGRG